MKLMQCNKKHYYDGDKFTSCPYCTGKTGARSYIGENINETNYTSFAKDSHSYGKHTHTEIIEKRNYKATEIIREDIFSGEENIVENKLGKK